jgi:hypothetical protein
MGYAYVLDGKRYAGFFVIYGNDLKVSKLHADLAGHTVRIRYNPSDPNTSLLENFSDSRFGGLTATQNAEWLSQAPAFDLQDALR